MPTRPYTLAPTSCAAVARALHEPLGGTAPQGRAWLCIEYPAPWGAQPLGDDAILAGVLPALRALTEPHGIGTLLVRRHGHARHLSTRVTALLASTVPGSVRMARVEASPEELLPWDFGAFAAGQFPPGATQIDEPILLVCVNGKRDACCAVAGRALAADLAAHRPDQVWECTHLGGHRFAPTALLLPSGQCFGHLDAESALAALDGGVVPSAMQRGRSTWSPAGQVAELAVRDTIPGLARDSVTVTDLGNTTFYVEADDSTRFEIVVGTTTADVGRPNKCGGPDVTPTSYHVESLTQLSLQR